MPTQGPGTKLVLKGLKLAFPGIAEQRAREEQEDRENSSRKHASRNVSGDNQQRPSVHSKAANQEDYNAPEDNVRQESIERGPSVHSNGESRNQTRGQNRSGSIQQGRSNYPNGESRGSRFEDHMPPENIQRGSSMHLNSGNRRLHRSSRDEGNFRPDIEEVRYTHTSSRSRQSSIRQDQGRTVSTQGVVGSRRTNGGRH